MGKQRSSFAKLQRDRAKAAKKAAKLAVRQGKADSMYGPAPSSLTDEAEVEEVEEEDGSSVVAQLLNGKGELSAPELLQMIEVVHAKLEAGDISHEEFEDAKVEIFARLPMD